MTFRIIRTIDAWKSLDLGRWWTIGPSGVTLDEVPADASGLKIESRVGSEILQSSNTGNMIWSVAQTIATISEYTTLEPGDLIAMGTPPGVGHAKKPNPPLAGCGRDCGYRDRRYRHLLKPDCRRSRQ